MKPVTVIFAIFLLSAYSAAAQHKSWCECTKERSSETRIRHRYALWPNTVCAPTVIDGLSAGVFAGPINKESSLKINGLNIEADPLPVLAVPWASIEVLMMLPRAIAARKERDLKSKSNPGYDDFDQKDSTVQTTVNGLNISTGIVLTKTKINGGAVNVAFGIEQEMRGVEISGVFNFHRTFGGVITAPFNLCRKGSGVQIGLYNYCREGNVVQIGLINKYGRSIRPFFNIGRKRRSDKLMLSDIQANSKLKQETQKH